MLALIRGTAAEASVTVPSAPAVARPAPSAPSPAVTAHPGEPAGRLRVSPLARKVATELGVDITRVMGTGAQGAITREDVERAAAAMKVSVPTPGALAPDRTAAMRAAIAAAMARSKRDIPHYYLSTTIDMSTALAWLRAENEKRSMTERLLPAALLIKAVALGLREVPDLNGYWMDGAFRKGGGIHIGVAISLRGGGLVAPALHDADKTNLTTLMRQLQDLVARARSSSLKARTRRLHDHDHESWRAGCGVDLRIVYPPQVALVGFGKISERPWAAPARSKTRPLLTATLSADHRATDGHRGGVFLTAVDRLLQAPEKL